MKGSGSSLTLFQINGDTGANYSYHQLYGDGSSTGGAGSANVTQPFFGEVTTTSSVMGVAIIDYLDYANTNKYKTTRSLMGRDENGSGTVRLFSGSWRNTNAITSLSLYPDGGNSCLRQICAQRSDVSVCRDGSLISRVWPCCIS